MDSNTSSISLRAKTATIIFKQEQPQSSCCSCFGFCPQKQVTYRIPALIYISDHQTLLAFAEKRKATDDTNAEVLVMRRGLWKDDAAEWVSGHQVLTSASLPNHRSMNPCPVYERESKTLFLFFICVPVGVSENQQICENKNQARLCYITSKNTGKTWSAITDLTADVIGKNWATFAVGPGHGVQMKSGRLIIPAYLYPEQSLSCNPISHAFAIYSNDKGKTWQLGNKMESESGECQMAEIIDEEGNSKLYCNARSKSGFRLEALSDNKGETFHKPSKQELRETGSGCQGSVLSVAPDQTWLLYCHPTNTSERMDLGVYLNKSPSNSSGWEDPKLILHEGPSGYCDLTQRGDGEHFACLMECGEKSEVEGIGFRVFELKDLGEQ